MGGSDRGNNRNFRWIVPGSILDSVREVEKTPDQEFEKLYKWIKEMVYGYRTLGERTAVIAGWMRGMPPETLITTVQVSQILALRYPEKE